MLPMIDRWFTAAIYSRLRFVSGYFLIYHLEGFIFSIYTKVYQKINDVKVIKKYIPHFSIFTIFLGYLLYF